MSDDKKYKYAPVTSVTESVHPGEVLHWKPGILKSKSPKKPKKVHPEGAD